VKLYFASNQNYHILRQQSVLTLYTKRMCDVTAKVTYQMQYPQATIVSYQLQFFFFAWRLHQFPFGLLSILSLSATIHQPGFILYIHTVRFAVTQRDAVT
jgi:hypothetical protein